jgi:chitinase
MKKHILSILPVLFLVISDLSGQNLAPCKQVIGYYPDWQWYDRGQLVRPTTIDYSKYTILNYCFFNPQANGTIALGDSWAEQNLLQGQFDWNTNTYIPNTSVVDLAHNANVKVLVSIGGWTWSTNFPAIAADPVKRAQFAHDCNYYVSYYNLDGIDIDWEYPAQADAANFTTLLQQIRDSLNALELHNNEQYLLTAAVSAASANMQNVQWGPVSANLDLINLMSYDFFGAWDAVANHNSPLYAPGCGDPAFNIHSAFNTLTQLHGVPAAKINIGVAFYGRTQTGFSSLCGSTSGNAATAAFPPDGTPMYYDVVNALSNYTYHWDNAAHVPWLSGNGVFVSYDNEQSIAEKAQYINNVGAAGAIIWEITGDYIETSPGSGVIAGTPLADTLNAVLCGAPLSVIGNQSIEGFELFPNPVENGSPVQLQFGKPCGTATIQVLDATGKICISAARTWSNGQLQFQLPGLNPGLFLVQVIFTDGMVSRPLVVK